MEKSKEKLQELVEEFPDLFRNISPMISQYNRFRGEPEEDIYFYFQCADGWSALLKNLLNVINHRLKRYRDVVRIKADVIASGKEPLPWIAEYFKKHDSDPLETFQIDQIKEKFGGLRFYWSGVKGEDAAHIEGAIRVTEGLSYIVCELCGAPGECGTVPHSGYIQTLCASHKEEKRQEIEERSKKMTQKHPRDGLN